MSVYVGMDVHRKRSQVAVLDDAGDELRNRNVPNDPAQLVPILGALPSGTPVAFEVAYGWGWLVDLLDDLGLEPHLVHPSRCEVIAAARLTNGWVDARTLVHLLHADLLPEASDRPAGGPGLARPAAPPGQPGPPGHHRQAPGPRGAGRPRRPRGPAPVGWTRAGVAADASAWLRMWDATAPARATTCASRPTSARSPSRRTTPSTST
jgi:hypothetical protein